MSNIMFYFIYFYFVRLSAFGIAVTPRLIPYYFNALVPKVAETFIISPFRLGSNLYSGDYVSVYNLILEQVALNIP